MSADRRSGRSRRIDFLALLAVAGIGAAAFVAHRRRAPAVSAGAESARIAAMMANLDASGFERLCAAYHEAHGFRVKPIRWRGGDRDAELYFGTLSQPVALLRCLDPGLQAFDVGAIDDLPGIAGARGIPRIVVHATGGYTDSAAAFAHGRRIRLVSGVDLARRIAGMPGAHRSALVAVMRNAGMAPASAGRAVAAH